MSKDKKYYRHWAYKTVFVYILGFIFMMFCAKTDVHNKYMIELYGWLIFWTRSFIRHNYFKFVWKDDLNVHIFQNRNWCSPKSDQLFFFWLWQSDPSIGRILGGKNLGVQGCFLKKQKLCMQNLMKEQKQSPVVILQQLIFYNISLWCL